MHKHLLFAAALLGITGAALAQPTINAADYNYVPGDGYIQYMVGQGQVPDPGAGGNNVTWDFSTITSAIADTFSVVTCASTPHCSLYPGSTVAALYTSQPTQYAYYYGDANRFSVQGIHRYIPQISQTTSMVYVEPQDQIRYPFTTTTSYSDSFATTYSTNGYPYLRRGHMDVYSDGYGTLKLPGGKTYTNVIRIVRKETYNDSTNFGSGPLYNYYHSVIYEWRQPGTKVSLMSRDSLHILMFTQSATSSTGARYATPFPAGIEEVAAATNSMTVYPNPAKDVLHIKFTAGNSEQVRITLINMIGQEAAVIANQAFNGTTQEVSYNTASLPRGLYLLRMQTTNGTTTQKVEIL